MSISIIGADTKSLGDHATQDGVEGQIVAFSKQMNWYDVATDYSDMKKITLTPTIRPIISMKKFKNSKIIALSLVFCLSHRYHMDVRYLGSSH